MRWTHDLIRYLPFLIHVPLLCYLAFAFYRTQTREPLRRWFWGALILKCAAGIAVGLLYLHHYPYRGDTFALFEESAALSKFAFRQPGDYLKILFLNDFSNSSSATLLLKNQPRAFFAAKLFSCLNLFTFHNYWITGLYCSLFSFLGFWRLANVLASVYPRTRTAAITAFLLFPSVVFWSSGVLKESIAMGCFTGILAIGLPFYFSAKRKDRGVFFRKNVFAHTKNSWKKCLCIVLFGWIVWQLKFYYLGALLPAALSLAGVFVVYGNYGISHGRVLRFWQILFFCAVFGAAPLLIGHMTGHSLLASIIANHDATVSISKPGTYVVFDTLLPTVRSFAAHFPLALWSGLFAPLPWQARNWLAFGAGLENAVLLGLAVLCLAKTCLSPKKKFHLFSSPVGLTLSKDTILTRLLVRAAWLYILSLAAVLAFSSPNFGALARYKIGFLPFLVYILLAGLPANPQKTNNRNECERMF